MRMKHILACGTVLLVLVGAWSVRPASAQLIDGRWYKLKVQCDLIIVNPNTLTISQTRVTVPAYVHFVFQFPWNAPRGMAYHMDVWQRNSTGHWIKVRHDQVLTADYSENILYLETMFQVLGGTVEVMAPSWIRVSPGLFIGAGEIWTGFAKGLYLFGGATITGNLVTTLPFTPN